MISELVQSFNYTIKPSVSRGQIHTSLADKTPFAVESRTGIWQRSVSCPRSSNRTGRFPASGFPIGFTKGPTENNGLQAGSV
jgi:hypothetical protein